MKMSTRIALGVIASCFVLLTLTWKPGADTPATSPDVLAPRTLP